VTLVHRCGRTIRRPGYPRRMPVAARVVDCRVEPGDAHEAMYASVHPVLNAAQKLALSLTGR
jgi:hypothetical protein